MDAFPDVAADAAFCIASQRVLHADGTIGPARIGIAQGLITDGTPGSGFVLDAGNHLVLPGLVDIHGDAFERQVMPRPKVHFPLDLALLDTDRQLVANGITTAFHGVTWSWEPGLRSGDAALRFLETLQRVKPRLGADTRAHIRWETHFLDAVPQIERCLEDGRIDLLAFNDHFPGVYKARHGISSTMLERSGQTNDEYRVVLERLHERRAEVPAAMERLAAVARRKLVTLLSHDDWDADVRRAMFAMGCTIAEFPMSLAAAREARLQGCPTVFGAPNVVRGGSHTKAVRAADMVREGLCTVLASDYFYPSMLPAPFILARELGMPFGAAWDLVSANAAVAAGLPDRGRIQTGLRADLVVVDDSDPALPRVLAPVAGGRLVYRTA